MTKDLRLERRRALFEVRGLRDQLMDLAEKIYQTGSDRFTADDLAGISNAVAEATPFVDDALNIMTEVEDREETQSRVEQGTDQDVGATG